MDETGCQMDPASDFVQLISMLTSGCRLMPPTDLSEWLGFCSPRVLLLPLEVQVPRTVYQTVGCIPYATQLVHFIYKPVKGRLPVSTSHATPLLEEGVVVGKSESDSEYSSSSGSNSCPSSTELLIPNMQIANRFSASTKKLTQPLRQIVNWQRWQTTPRLSLLT